MTDAYRADHGHWPSHLPMPHVGPLYPLFLQTPTHQHTDYSIRPSKSSYLLANLNLLKLAPHMQFKSLDGQLKCKCHANLTTAGFAFNQGKASTLGIKPVLNVGGRNSYVAALQMRCVNCGWRGNADEPLVLNQLTKGQQYSLGISNVSEDTRADWHMSPSTQQALLFDGTRNVYISSMLVYMRAW